MPFKNNSGNTNIPLLILLAAAGLIIYTLFTRSFSFEDRLLNIFYYKQPSEAFENINIPPQIDKQIETVSWEETWSRQNFPGLWDKVSFDCISDAVNNTLTLNCQNGYLVTKNKWNKDSTIIINGSFSSKSRDTIPFKTGIGLFAPGSQTPFLSLLAQPSILSSANDFAIENYREGEMQKFRIVYTKINNDQFVYYYLGDNPQPVKKTRILIDENPAVFLSCSGICSFEPVIVSGVTAD